MLKNRKTIILFTFIVLFITLSAVSLSFSLLNSKSTNFPFTKMFNTIEDLKVVKKNANDFQYFKDFSVIEQTGFDQTNVIIDPINFTEDEKYCYINSIRIYKEPYDTTSEVVSQVYNIETNAYENFASSPDFGDPSGWSRHENAGTNIW
ncbi:MAG: hypothetical protein ACTSRG_07115, partial [Candidatus Helarchaeota archaeon]